MQLPSWPAWLLLLLVFAFRGTCANSVALANARHHAEVLETLADSAAAVDWQCLLDVGVPQVLTPRRHPRRSDAISGSVTAMSVGDVSTKNKLTLVALETFPLVGWLGFDRIYLGQVGLGLLKMSICILTLFIGGAIWGLLDGYIVITSALARETSINRLGIVAKFDAQQVEAARFLAIVTLICWAALAACCIRAAGARLRKDKTTSAAASEGNVLFLADPIHPA